EIASRGEDDAAPETRKAARRRPCARRSARRSLAEAGDRVAGGQDGRLVADIGRALLALHDVLEDVDALGALLALHGHADEPGHGDAGVGRTDLERAGDPLRRRDVAGGQARELVGGLVAGDPLGVRVLEGLEVAGLVGLAGLGELDARVPLLEA